ncbi:hypothetical protein [Actinophytocola oryzae]|uniref:hypothetical protein n=1 Tax=Actinophytocola oryzae TaxID=502181 RepID=UPI0010641A50|nr:hypothetical protein [Actinophytocola oryzae]
MDAESTASRPFRHDDALLTHPEHLYRRRPELVPTAVSELRFDLESPAPHPAFTPSLGSDPRLAAPPDVRWQEVSSWRYPLTHPVAW